VPRVGKPALLHICKYISVTALLAMALQWRYQSLALVKAAREEGGLSALPAANSSFHLKLGPTTESAVEFAE
jgi:hypothetical protein